MSLYARWIWANAWSELAGLGGTGIVTWTLLAGTDQAGTVVILAAALAAVLAGAVIEGGVVGWAQWRVLATSAASVPKRHWVAATVVGAGVAWLLGMIPSTAATLSGPPAPEQAGPEGAVVLILAAVMGLALGPILATPQWVVLKRHVPRAAIWIPANALAWAVGMVIIFAGMGTLSEASPAWRMVLTGLISCGIAGTAVGAVHGAFLVRLLRRRPPHAATM